MSADSPSIPCPECGKRLTVEQGKTVACGRCGAKLTLPGVERRETKIADIEAK